MKVLVYIDFNSGDFNRHQQEFKPIEKPMSDECKEYEIYSETDNKRLWFVADYQIFPQIGWYLSTPFGVLKQVKVITLCAPQETANICALISAS
ncbi:hypothetical protein [Nostoc parmelioides]|uniref:Uncharacterized protein n=1 Tax=Nostoc parmelioides FACHB-3921 TaxID=2692909 RepID=A0ABR8BQF3_9NOSO|nr:hypothetical protein [Nostoc parmelioides]MBD2255145.1 hypothetical protein [Nostoc parmelioides FACHB-3921]